MEIRQIDTLPAYVREAIATGETRIICPTCNGGRSRESSLSIRPIEGGLGLLKLSCWRATCSWFCTVVDKGTVIERRTLKPGTVYDGGMYPLCMLEVELGNDYGLHMDLADAHGWRTDATRKTLIMPIVDRYGGTIGHFTRTFDTPKRCFTYKATARPWLDYWFVDKDAPMVIVEDCLSACRLASVGINAVSLLGTTMAPAQAKDIDESAEERTLYLALDRDAFEKSLQLQKRYAHVLGLGGVTCLTEDIKNIESDDDIRMIFNAT